MFVTWRFLIYTSQLPAAYIYMAGRPPLHIFHSKPKSISVSHLICSNKLSFTFSVKKAKLLKSAALHNASSQSAWNKQALILKLCCPLSKGILPVLLSTFRVNHRPGEVISGLVIVKLPRSKLGWLTLPTVFHISIIICRSFLYSCTGQHGEDADTHRVDSHCRRPWVIQNIEADVTVAVYVGMQRRRTCEYHLRRVHGIFLRKLDLQLIVFTLVKRAGSTIKFNDPPLQIIRGHELETGGRIGLPFSELLLEAFDCDPAKVLSGRGGHLWQSKQLSQV